MEVIRNLDETVARLGPSVVTFGNFDGVHLGHQALFERVVQDARRLEANSVIYTFDPHPLRILAPERAPKSIGSLEERIALIDGCRVDVVVIARFTREYSLQEPEDFIEQVLVEKLGVKEVVVGFNCRFGRAARGTSDLLRSMGARLGFDLLIVEPFCVGGEPISSTRIRRLLESGEVAGAANLLGRRYEVRGKVVTGRRRGKTIGFPTANIETGAEIIPAGGIYAVTVERGQEKLLGVANLGTKPTFGKEEFTIEVNILDFEQDLYGETLAVGFVQRLREERAYPSVGALVEQIQADITEARALFRARGIP